MPSSTPAQRVPLSAKLEDTMDIDSGRRESYGGGIETNGESSYLMMEEAINNGRRHIAVSNRLSMWRLTATWMLIGVMLGVTVTMLTTLTRHTSDSGEGMTCPGYGQAETTDCGESPAEARSRGCKFDVMSFSWLPSACYDDELSSEFSQLQDWKWYAHKGINESVIPEDVVELGEHDHLYVSAEYHFFHCTFMWRKLHRAALGLRYMDSYIYNYNHTRHCEHKLRHMSPSVIDSTIRRKYPACWPAYAPH